MSSAVQRPPLRTRLRAALLRISWRIVFSRIGRAVVLGPLIVVGYYAHACFVAFGPRPEVEIDPGSTVTPEIAQFLTPENKRFFALIQEARKVPKRTEITERERAVAQTMTWGMAGAAVVILTAIATSSKTFNGHAISVAAGCFAFAIPLLIAFGLAFSKLWEPPKAPPTGQESRTLGFMIHAAHLLFGVGLASLIWSFSARVAIVFLVACYLGKRAFNNLVFHRLPPLMLTNAPTQTAAEGSSQADQVAGDTPQGPA